MNPERALGRALSATLGPLVALRIVVAGLCLTAAEPRHAIDWIKSGAPLVTPFGLGWFAEAAPLDASTANIIRVIYYASAALALVGLYTRFALVALGATAFYLFAVNSMGGAVLHDMHLLWFIAVLAVSPCGETGSLDAHFAGRPFIERTAFIAQNGVPVFLIRTLLGLVYFFPGLHKIRESGFAWALSDNLANQMHAKWLQFDQIPFFRIDTHPSLLHAAGLFVLAFELLFVFLVHVGPRTRIALALAGIAFHLASQVFMFIPFASLWMTYVILFDAPAKSSSDLPRTAAGETSPHRALPASALLVGAALLVPVAIQGARGVTQSFPFACYPTFQRIADPELPDLSVTAVTPEGERDVPVARDALGHRSQASWGAVWSIAGIYGAPFSEARLRQFLLAEANHEPGRSRFLEAPFLEARSVRVDLTRRSTLPERWRDPPRKVRTLATFSWPLSE